MHYGVELFNKYSFNLINIKLSKIKIVKLILMSIVCRLNTIFGIINSIFSTRKMFIRYKNNYLMKQ